MADDSRSGCMLDDPHKSNVLFVRPLAMPCSNPRRQSPLPSARPAPACSSARTMHARIHVHRIRTCTYTRGPAVKTRFFCGCGNEMSQQNYSDAGSTTSEYMYMYGISHVHMSCMVKNYSDLGLATHHARRAQPSPPSDIRVSPRGL